VASRVLEIRNDERIMGIFLPMNANPERSETYSFAAARVADSGVLELLRSLNQSFSCELGYFLHAKSPHGLGRIPLDERLIVGETSRRSMGLPTCYHAGWNILLAIRWPDGRR